MDRKTAEYYSAHSSEVSERYNSAGERGIDRWFKEIFPAGSSVLDIGCGSGRDMALLRSMGYDVYGVDASAEMCADALKTYPELHGRIIRAELPSDTLYFNRTFDCVVCSALLMHIPGESLEAAAETIKMNLSEEGRLLVSIPLKRDDLDEEGRTPDGRLHLVREHRVYTTLFESHGFSEELFSSGSDALGRGGIEWGVIFFRRKTA